MKIQCSAADSTLKLYLFTSFYSSNLCKRCGLNQKNKLAKWKMLIKPRFCVYVLHFWLVQYWKKYTHFWQLNLHAKFDCRWHHNADDGKFRLMFEFKLLICGTSKHLFEFESHWIQSKNCRNEFILFYDMYFAEKYIENEWNIDDGLFILQKNECIQPVPINKIACILNEWQTRSCQWMFFRFNIRSCRFIFVFVDLQSKEMYFSNKIAIKSTQNNWIWRRASSQIWLNANVVMVFISYSTKQQQFNNSNDWIFSNEFISLQFVWIPKHLFDKLSSGSMNFRHKIIFNCIKILTE